MTSVKELLIWFGYQESDGSDMETVKFLMEKVVEGDGDKAQKGIKILDVGFDDIRSK